LRSQTSVWERGRKEAFFLVPKLRFGNTLTSETPFRVSVNTIHLFRYWKRSFQGHCVPKLQFGNEGGKKHFFLVPKLRFGNTLTSETPFRVSVSAIHLFRYWKRSFHGHCVPKLKFGNEGGNFELAQNYPNPFNPETEIAFSLSEASKVSLKIFNVLGQEVATLLNQSMSLGKHTLKWNATDENGMRVPAGVYFYQLQTGKQIAVKKMILLP